jgi:hypothetical protein
MEQQLRRDVADLAALLRAARAQLVTWSPGVDNMRLIERIDLKLSELK